MRRIVPVVLVALAFFGRTASASPPTATLLAGPMLLTGDESYPVLGHALLGVEWLPDGRGVGLAVDGGWLWYGTNLFSGLGTLSPSVLVPVRRGHDAVSLRAGLTLATGERLVLGGLVIEHQLSHGRRFRVEVRDAVGLGDYRLNAAEVVLGFAFADERP